MTSTPNTIESTVEAYVSARARGERVDPPSFAGRFPQYGDELLEALETFELLDSMHAERRPLAPVRVGPYRVLREIGRGGMGVVYEALEEPLGRRVALKLLPREMLVSRAARARFEREAALAARLEHEGICAVYGAGVLEGQPWIALRFVEGETLGRRIADARDHGRATLSLPGSDAANSDRAVVACIARVARALAAAHAQGVLHRDVKPSNVMLRHDGVAVLLDFGLAIEHDDDSARLTRTGDLAGTPAYLAPELIAGGNARLNAQCDVYALGVTLYECLTLRAPFGGATRDALYHAVLTTDAPDLRRLRPDAPRDLAVIVATALAREPSARYSSAEHFARDLEAFLARRPILARPIGPWGRFTRWIRRRPDQALLSVSLLVVSLVAAVSSGFFLASRDDARAGAEALRAREIDAAIYSAFVHLGERRREEALAEFERVLERAPDNQEARVGRVFALLRLGRDAEAAMALRDAPSTPAYDSLRALAAGEAPQLDDPAWLETASADELFLDGERLRLAGDRRPLSEQRVWMQRALSRFDEAIVRSPHARILFHQLRAWTAASAGDLASARSAAFAIAELWPDSAVALYQAGSSLVELDPAAALPLLERATRLDPSRSAAFQCLGVAHYRLGALTLARQALEHALELRPDNSFALNVLACVLGDLDCRVEQRVALTSSLAIAPESVPTRSNLALLEWQTGDLAAAARELEDLLAFDPGLLEQREALAQLRAELGDSRSAREQVAIALAYAPRDAGLWLEFAKHSLAAGAADEALEALETASALDPTLAGCDVLREQAEFELDAQRQGASRAE